MLLFLAIIGTGCDWTLSPVDAGPEDGREEFAEATGDGEEQSEDGADEPEDAAEVCEATGDELCDGVDNDCDGDTDEDFDLRTDGANCGACGWACEVARGTAACVEGICTIAACDDGYLDLDGAAFDGCEYECTATAAAESPDGGGCENGLDDDCDGRSDAEDGDCAACVPESCDGLDNDCDDLTDEDFDLQADPVHCGSCGRDCPIRPHGVPACVRGECSFDCVPGWADADHDERNGCEATCTPSPAPDETTCDGIDADCDGFVDEDYVPDWCGTGACEAPAVCWHGVEDCTPLEPAYTIDAVCDGIDQDCDGTTDEDYVPSVRCVGLCRDTADCTHGVEVCGTPPAAADELCDGLDEDCDGTTDEDYVPYTCGWGGCIRTSTCIDGMSDCISGGATDEVCNGSDDDCDGVIDETTDPRAMCPPPAHVSTTACLNCGPGCGRCGIVPGGCAAGYHDINEAYSDGCECQQEATEPTSSACPGLVRDLGDLPDNGATAEIRGNCVPVGDVDWYRFRAVDNDDGACDQFHVVVEFVVNPDDAFRFDVFRDDGPDGCLGLPDTCGLETGRCEGEAVRYDRNMAFMSGAGRDRVGECPCSAVPSYGRNVCSPDTQYYFVKVYRPGAATTCDSYTIQISNGVP
ncbi:MAG: hypothetical protein JXB32_11300 [Deltaproteobacteria bacterium]|nr:hypothetical protein [Deltaproteobacteria bacterium]